MSKTYTTFQAASIIGVSPPTIIKWAYSGKIQSFRTLGGHRRIPHEEVERILRLQKKTTKDYFIVALVSDIEYGVLLQDFFEGRHKIVQVNDTFSLGLALGQMPEVTHLLWDFYENTHESLLVLSKIKQDPRLASIVIVAFLPLSGQLNSSLRPYFHVHYPKNSALKKLEELLR